MVGKLRLLLWIGIIILFVPFVGVPDTLRTILTIFLGIVIIYLTFKLKFLYKELKFSLRQGVQTDETSL